MSENSKRAPLLKVDDIHVYYGSIHAINFPTPKAEAPVTEVKPENTVTA